MATEGSRDQVDCLYEARKPIYDDLALVRTPLPEAPEAEPTIQSRIVERLPDMTPNDARVALRSRATVTDRLTEHIRRARLFTYAHAGLAEDHINRFMSRVLDQERSFTQTIASLAPPPEAKEKITPGGLYVLVAAMAGSIMSRNRGVFLRSLTPLAVGIGAAQIVLPVTSRNVGNLIWTYEERVPFIATNHMRIRGATEEGWRQAHRRSQEVSVWSSHAVRDSRQALQRLINRTSGPSTS